MSSENVKTDSLNLGKSILSPQNRNRTLLLKKNVQNEEVEGSGAEEISPIIKVTPAKSTSKMQTTPKKGDSPGKSMIKGETPKSGIKKESSLGKKTIVDITSSGLLGHSGKLREKKQSVPFNLLKGTTNIEAGKSDVNKSIKPPNSQGSVLPLTKNAQNSAKILNMVNKINATKDLSPNIVDFDPFKSKLVKTSKNNINNRSHLFGHEPATYTTNPLIIEDLIDELEEKAKNYFIMFSKERKEREKLERQCYWMQEENKTLQNTLKNQMTTIQGLQNKIIDLRGNPNVITETIERIDMLYTQLDTLIQAFAGICSYITFNEPTDRREIIELVLEYLHPCRGLDLRLNSLYGSIYYFKLGIIKDLPPPIQPPEKIPGYDVWQPPPPQKADQKDSDNSRLQPHMQQGNSLSKVADNYMNDGPREGAAKASISDKTNKDEHSIPKISTPVASTKQSVVPTSSSQLTGDINVPLSGFEIKIKSVQGIEPIGDGKGKLSFVARIDNESSTQCKNNPKRRSSEYEYKISHADNKGSIEKEMILEIDTLPPKSPGLIPRFTIDMWDSSITSGPIGHASKTFIDPYTLLPEQPWDVTKEDGDKPLATLIITVAPKPGNSMLPAGRLIVAKESKNKQDPTAKKESKLSRLSFRGDKESKGSDKINSMLRPALNNGKRAKSTGNLDDKDEKNEKLKEGTDLTKSVVKPLSIKETTSVPPPAPLAPPAPPSPPTLSKSEAQESPSVLKSSQITVKEPSKASEGDTNILKKSMINQQPPKEDLKSSIKAPPVPKSGPGNEKTEEEKLKSSEPIIKENVTKSNLLAPKSDLIKSDALKKSTELGKSQVDSKSMIIKKMGSGALDLGKKSISAPKTDVKSSTSENTVSKEISAPTPIKIVPKIIPKPAITKEQPTNNAPKAVQVNNLAPGKVKQITPAIIKKIDVKPAVVKPKIATAAPVINIKKPGSPIQIKPKGIELGKPAVTITPKFAASPPKPASGAAAGGAASAQPKGDLKILVTKGAANISPKIVPKVKITPKIKM
ncbi:Uncharacterized protein CTYZ_00001603 [Cryptosporidium tyzzeri]|nr:Uncharacterized protein CTYZ_00001603 [Cryptosporidium tyzzeri]